MNLINRNTFKAKLNPASLKIKSEDYIYFNKSAVDELGLQAGKFLHFVNDGTLWYFHINEDPDGFCLVRHDKRHPGLQLSSRGLIKMMCKSMNVKKGYSFTLEKILTHTENGGPLQNLIKLIV